MAINTGYDQNSQKWTRWEAKVEDEGRSTGWLQELTTESITDDPWRGTKSWAQTKADEEEYKGKAHVVEKEVDAKSGDDAALSHSEWPSLEEAKAASSVLSLDGVDRAKKTGMDGFINASATAMGSRRRLRCLSRGISSMIQGRTLDSRRLVSSWASTTPSRDQPPQSRPTRWRAWTRI
jgi:hypothetical protein